ncbi:MAG: formate--tetrahydrofolate ligase [Oscillospiraceae bacterium]|nr:formate--tetrahydrofolate ligase [Oscillospiraceae bacterium]
MENKEQEPIHILNLFIRFKNAFAMLWPLVLVLALLLGIFSYQRARKSFTSMYECRAIFTVSAGYTAEDIFGTGAYYDQYNAQQLAAAFPQIVSTDMMRDMVVQQLDKGYINAYATATAVAESNMLVLTVTGPNPQDAYDYTRALMNCYPLVAGVMVDNPQMHVVTSPELPTEPYNSFNGFSAIIKGVILGVVVALLFIFLCALLTRTLQTTEELKTAVNIPILVALPKVDRKKRRSGNNSLITADIDPNLTESFRGLRVKIKKMLEGNDKKVIMVTSTLAGEGKTTVSINLATALQRDGHKVVILDADLRSQSVAANLGESADGAGLMDCLRDKDLPILGCVRTCEKFSIDFISGLSTNKRHYAVDLNRFRMLLDELCQYYDYVVVDTAPSEIVSETTAMCRCAQCVLYVVRQDHVQSAQVINTISTMHQKDVKIAGCIFNGVPKFHRQYGYGYRSAYGYGYDYGYRKYRYGSSSSYGYSGYGYRYGYSGYSSYQKETKKSSRRKK